MALINCRECNKEITSKLKKCLHCGVRNPNQKTLDQTKKSFKALGIIIVSLIIFGMIIGEDTSSQKAPPRAQSAAEQREDRIKFSFSAWDGAHIDLTRVIKKSMNDPSSYEHVATDYHKNDDGQTLTVKTIFRGKNGFGGVVVQSVIAKTNIQTGKVIEVVEQE